MPKQWPGTQSEQFQNTSDMKPIPAPCDGKQFADNPYTFDAPENYDTPRFDRFNNETVNSNFHSESATASQGTFGGRQYSDFQKADGYSGYGVEIPHGTSAAFNRAETVFVAVDRSDRGKSE